ncbi:MAG: polyprenyl synthetase family protein [Woeseiaceae bacterium]|nr:polyprenyl synthetase family protein [Woeseiaceae bacterium]
MRIPDYVSRVERYMDAALPAQNMAPDRLHSAMRYAAFSGGKRIRPLLVYATGECLDIDPDRLDMPATAIEFIHAFSLVHDDLPAMDDDDLRRGRPTVHRQYDEATAILAADALQPLAFEVIATADQLTDSESRQLIALIAHACGSLGMTGGQAIDLESEGRALSVGELATMHGLKTGALISASVMSACCLAPNLQGSSFDAMERFSRKIGLAFQIRDDILDVEGETDVIGKPSGSDEALNKATWPALFGMDKSKRRCRELYESASDSLDAFGEAADSLRFLATLIVNRVQ